MSLFIELCHNNFFRKQKTQKDSKATILFTLSLDTVFVYFII